MRLPFCSQKEKRDENAMLADLLSWAVMEETGDGGELGQEEGWEMRLFSPQRTQHLKCGTEESVEDSKGWTGRRYKIDYQPWDIFMTLVSASRVRWEEQFCCGRSVSKIWTVTVFILQTVTGFMEELLSFFQASLVSLGLASLFR